MALCQGDKYLYEMTSVIDNCFLPIMPLLIINQTYLLPRYVQGTIVFKYRSL